VAPPLVKGRALARRRLSGIAFLIVIGLLFGGMLITAGILACMSNKAYKEYRATKGL
jgi:hypothetical protein